MTSPYYDPVDIQYAGLHALSQLTDVNISSPQNGQALTWTGTSWQNQTIPKQIFYNAYGSPINGQFMGYIGMSSDESKTYVLAPENLIVSQISISMNVDQSFGNYWAYTLRKNGLNTSFVCLVSNAGISQFYGSISYNAGDLMSIAISAIGAAVPPTTNTLTITYLI